MITIKILILNILLISNVKYLKAAKILAILPFPGPSQYIAVQPYLKALAARGHDLTVVSQFPLKEKLENFRDITFKLEGYEELISSLIKSDKSDDFSWAFELIHNVTLKVLEHQEVQALMKSKTKFDLLFIESFHNEALFALTNHFEAHLIGFSTFGTNLHIDQYVGNTSPVSYIPLGTLSLRNRMNFWQRLENLKAAALDEYNSKEQFKIEYKMYKKYFPKQTQNLEDIRKNFSLVLLNQHFSLSFPRPYVPNMIEVGGLHIDHKPKPLPKDIENFITTAEHGVIYFSMGSNVKSKDFPKEKFNAVFNVFKSLKQRVLWKFEKPNLSGKPDNVFISKWFPQPDILAHPNVKLFITHSGLLSTIEAIHYAKPVVGIPVFFDQFLNIEHAKQMGFALGLPYKKLNEFDLKNAILEILGNKSYTEAVKTISKRYHDQPMKPLEKAIYWTEYILRHNGADHMRVVGRDLSFIEIYSLDTIGFILFIIILTSVFLSYFLKIILKVMGSFFYSDVKRKIA